MGRQRTASRAGRPVHIRIRNHAFRPRPAVRIGTLIVHTSRDPRLPAPNIRRYFWLLDLGIQMVYEPHGWPNEWRVDLTTITRAHTKRRETYTVRDMALDIVVEGSGPTYRILDLDDVGDRVVGGSFTPAEAADVLSRAQRFLDAYLHGNGSWPPPEIRPFFRRDHRYPRLSHATSDGAALLR